MLALRHLVRIDGFGALRTRRGIVSGRTIALALCRHHTAGDPGARGNHEHADYEPIVA
jgi:hypothetical protein